MIKLWFSSFCDKSWLTESARTEDVYILGWEGVAAVSATAVFTRLVRCEVLKRETVVDCVAAVTTLPFVSLMVIICSSYDWLRQVGHPQGKFFEILYTAEGHLLYSILEGSLGSKIVINGILN